MEVCLPQPKASLIRLVVMVTLCAPVTSLALSSQPQTPKPGQTASASQAAPVPTFHSTSRIVTLEISAKDKHGKAISGLKASDFQVFEHELHSGKKNRNRKLRFFAKLIRSCSQNGTPVLCRFPPVFSPIS